MSSDSSYRSAARHRSLTSPESIQPLLPSANEQSAQSRLHRLTALLDNVKDLIVEIDRWGVITYSNPRSREFVDRNPEDLIGQPFDAFIHPGDLEMVRSRFARRMQGDKVVSCYEARLSRPDGSVRWCELSSSPMQDGEKICGVQVIVRDIAERKLAERKIRESEAILRCIMTSSTDHIMLVDLTGHIQFVNRTIGNLDVDDALGKPIYSLVATEFHQRIRECLQTVSETRQPGRYDIEYFSSEDQLVHALEARVSPVIEDGAVAALTIIATDITERKRVESELHEQQAKLAHVGRLRTSGELVVGIAHEVCQPLAAIANLAAACVRISSADEIDRKTLTRWLEKIDEAAHLTDDIIRRWRTFVNNSQFERCACDLRRIIGDSLKFMAGELRRNRVQITTAFDRISYIVDCDDVQIQQVLVNLLKNACDELTKLPAENRLISIHAHTRTDEFEVVVADNGLGFPQNDGERLFDRFYTSKADGMGMGLAISRSIISAHNGRLWADASELGGAAFHVALPVVHTEHHDRR